MTDERTRDRDELRAFFALFEPRPAIIVAFTLGATVLGVAVALAVLILVRN